MILTNILILVLTLIIFVQDLIFRAVSWVVFPSLTILFFFQKWIKGELLREVTTGWLYNIIFLFVQLLLVSIYFSIKTRSWTNIMRELLGWGDVLFLVCIGAYYTFIPYITFYVSSIVLALALWLLIQQLLQSASKQIPLAGLQALIFAGLFLFQWVNGPISWLIMIEELWTV